MTKINYTKARRNLNKASLERAFKKRHPEYSPLYKSKGLFNTESETFEVLEIGAFCLGFKNVYQFLVMLKDNDGNKFFHISQKMHWIKLSEYIANRFDINLPTTDLKIKKIDISNGRTMNIVSVPLEFEVENLYKLNYTLKSIKGNEYYIDANRCTFEPVIIDDSYDMFNGSDELIEKTVDEIKENNNVIPEDDDLTWLSTAGGE